MVQAGSVENTHFTFEHKVFAIEGCYFTLAGEQPVLRMRLGEIDVSIAFPQVCGEFEIDKASADGAMLDMVAEGLRFVRKIRPNDSIPTELLDGSASWSVEDRHRERAKKRMMIHIARWLSGGDKTLDASQLASSLDAKDTRALVQKQFEEIAEKIGYGRHRRQDVADRIDQFADELSYVEALKEQVQAIAGVRAKVAKLAGLHRQDPLLTEELMRMDFLIHAPLKRMADLVEDLYSQISDVITVLEDFQKLVSHVRNVRDTLRAELIDWEEVIRSWRDQPADASPEALATAKTTYRFLAQNYQQANKWASAG
ncbi:MAG: hypothetical protein ACFB6R_07720 [Alphaproteobacteria bacterium]